MQIYLFINGEQVGPYSTEKIQAMLVSGAVTPETMAWYEGLPEWTPVTQVVQPSAIGGPGDIVIEGGPPQLAGGDGEVVLNIQHQAEYSRGQLLLRTFLGFFFDTAARDLPNVFGLGDECVHADCLVRNFVYGELSGGDL